MTALSWIVSGGTAICSNPEPEARYTPAGGRAKDRGVGTVVVVASNARAAERSDRAPGSDRNT
jgi:hypothetical protein